MRVSEREGKRLPNGTSQAETIEERAGCWAWAGLRMGWLGTQGGSWPCCVDPPPPTNTLALLHQHSPETQEIFSLQLTLLAKYNSSSFFFVQKTCPSKPSRRCLRKREAAGSGLGMAEGALGRRTGRHSGLASPCSWKATHSSKNNSEM